MKTEIWNGHLIRFVEVNGEWLAVGNDVAGALGYANSADALTKHTESCDRMVMAYRDSREPLWNGNDFGDKTLLSEFGIYDLVFSSKLPSAKQFKRWVYEVIKRLREASNLQGYQVFRLLDKEHQKQTMAMLSHSLIDPKRQDFIKANTIANKAVSNRFGYPKMVKKDEMTPDMLNDREPILEATAHLIADKRNFGLDIHVSDVIYRKFPVKETA